METGTSNIDPRTARGVEIRPLALTDRERLAEAFSRRSEDTRRRRFGAVASRLGDGDLARLTRIDHHSHDALAAIVPDIAEAHDGDAIVYGVPLDRPTEQRRAA